MNVTLSWCLVLVPPGWWNVIICTNRKQTGLWVSGYCLFSLSQAQQHWEPDIRLTQLLFLLSTALESCVRVSSHWNADTGELPLRCLWHLASWWWSLLSTRACENKDNEIHKVSNTAKGKLTFSQHDCYPERKGWLSEYLVSESPCKCSSQTQTADFSQLLCAQTHSKSSH